ncbi:AraC family transcriptional regulator [Paenibacillus psychroresistens]|uniref:AraC family transcriptional regulator n=1 Tax=Paenibacillus psychroresistens TaxID=1778678 RepID=A0A6B8RHB9_9BACL|nr:AraC family transcriptional regulator [Paenibacillus psychroresistens]QGQ95600.1 AraC family transcriptional regulator [Paenibacillus psychroresistens]
MNSSYQLLLNSLKLTFLHITPYKFDYTWRIPSRQIMHAVIWYMEEGEIRFSINGINHEAKAGQLIFLPPQSVITGHAVSSQIGIISINFAAELSLLKGRIWSDIFKLPIAYPAYDMTIIEPVIRSMLRESTDSSFAQAMLLQSNLQRLLAIMFNQYFQFNDTKLLPNLDPRVQAVIEYISLQPEITPILAELCGVVQISESYLRKLFIDSTGMPPLTFIHQFKMEQAEKRLLSSTEKVAEIAYQLGYKDANYFSRLFKKKTCYTPNDYRKKLRNWMND